MTVKFSERTKKRFNGDESEAPRLCEAAKRIIKARMEAALTQSQLARMVGRTQMWMSHIESGHYGISDADAQKVLLAIRRLVALRSANREAREKLSQDVRLHSRPCAEVEL